MNTCKSIIKESEIIIVFGMSIGATDGTWWREIITWLGTNNRYELILAMWDNNYKRGNHRSELNMQAKFRESFLEFAPKELPEGVIEILRERIHIVCNCDLFKNVLKKKASAKVKELATTGT